MARLKTRRVHDGLQCWRSLNFLTALKDLRLFCMDVSAAALLTSQPIGPVPRPTRSWWLENIPSSTRTSAISQPADDAIEDVVVIGAGMTGCAVAYWLHRLFGQRCMILDARGCAGGATGRNGGHLWANPSSTFESETTRELLEFIKSEGVDCDLKEHGAAAFERRQPETDVKYFDAPDDPEKPSAEVEWSETEIWNDEACASNVQTNAFAEAYVYKDAAQFYLAKVANALLRHSGATLYAPVRVLKLEESECGSYQIIHWCAGEDETSATAQGVIRARAVVVATNAWAGELLPELQPYLYATRNQVIMTEPMPGVGNWSIGGFTVDSEIGARELYAIRRPDGRICIGGARALEPEAAVGNSDDSSTNDIVGNYLRRFLHESFPDLGEIKVEDEWTGVLGFTTDGNPIVGPIANRPGVFVAAGFCGHGMPRCFGVGKAIALLVSGSREQHDEIHPFLRSNADPSRFLQRSTAEHHE